MKSRGNWEKRIACRVVLLFTVWLFISVVSQESKVFPTHSTIVDFKVGTDGKSRYKRIADRSIGAAD